MSNSTANSLNFAYLPVRKTRGGSRVSCHCEEQGDEAIPNLGGGDCFGSAMTNVTM
jgi:hypothetical protein